ncbi:unnamed protein product [Didymodactylos carnosus]|uniref:Uncharacterized protein n=1 Tax=Didymodactylos carnosus TaxID=1234261 RepID=A0A814NZM7_9BILA|nr:unnamed protein product [Didymodactylos carnosus]CAF3864245.1 unnamed protein product [Didymodactylos carnosus]
MALFSVLGALSDTRPSTTPSMKRKLSPEETATLPSLLVTSLDLSSSPSQRTSATKLRIFKERSLETATDAQARKELYNELYKLIFSKQKRTHGGKIAMTYAWPLLIKQLIRCRYPSDIQDYVYHKNSIKLSLDDFIHAFKT